MPPTADKIRAEAELILLNKPFGVLCQFSGGDTRRTLALYVSVPNVYPAGRLDADSEGLVALTADGALQARITDPRHKMSKTYWAQVEGIACTAQLQELARGVELADARTRPARGLLGGMTETPTSAWGDARGEPVFPATGDWRRVGQIVHVFTHFRLRIQPCWLRLPGAAPQRVPSSSSNAISGS